MENARGPLTAWITPLELDAATGLTKGSAFRAFRRIESGWAEGCDFRVLDHGRDREIIEDLRRAGRIYASTVNLVLMSPALAEAVRVQMRRMSPDPAE